jgi:hypothetical protein
MKKRYCLLAAFLLMATFANAQIVNIPDPVFKAKLLSALPQTKSLLLPHRMPLAKFSLTIRLTQTTMAKSRYPKR